MGLRRTGARTPLPVLPLLGLAPFAVGAPMNAPTVDLQGLRRQVQDAASGSIGFAFVDLIEPEFYRLRAEIAVLRSQVDRLQTENARLREQVRP